MRGCQLLLCVLVVLSACGEAAQPPSTPGSSADSGGGQDLGVADSQAAGDSSGGDAAAEVEPGSDGAAGTDAQPEADAQLDANPQPEADATPETNAQPDANATPEIDAQPDANPQPDADTEPGADAQPSGDSQPGADSQPEADSASSGDSAANGSSDAAGDAAAGADTAVCIPTAPSSEVCDGLDNDCDGKTDDSDPCEDGNPCTQGDCAVVNGKKQCLQKPGGAGQACDDGNPCSASSACAQGVCAGDPTCSDGVACTLDACDPAKGCVFSASDAKCADGNSCTSDSCDPVKGCSNPAAPGACDDGDACSSGSACAAGVCVGNQPVACDDKNPCTADSCDKVKGCVYTATTAPCDDANACTTGEVCAAANCQGGKPKCDDGDLCTTDGCDAAGTCSHPALPGCKACTAASQCSDSDACTSDACTAGKCAWAPISGCVGPTNYTVKDLTLKEAAIVQGGGMLFTLTVTNFGKQHPGTYSSAMKWKLTFSQDDVIDAGDAAIYEKTWGGYNIGGNSNFGTPVTTGTDSANLGVGKPAAWYHKFACVQLTYSGDVNPADNSKCIPIVVKDGETSLLGIAAGKIMHHSLPNAASSLQLLTNNPGSDYNVNFQIFASNDGSWDAGDPLLWNVQAAKVPAGDQTVALAFKPGIDFNSLAKGKDWVCVTADLPLAKYDLKPNDNTFCAKVDFENPIDVDFEPGLLKFTNSPLANGLIGFTSVPQAPWSGDVGCAHAKLLNLAYGESSGPVAARCFIGTTTKIADAKWVLPWSFSDTLPGRPPGNVPGSLAVSAPSTQKLAAVGIGVRKLCIEVNYDKAQLETNFSNNVHCTDVIIAGANTIIDPQNTAENKGLPISLKAGAALTTNIVVKNIGNATLGGISGKFKVRVLLSKDNAVSAEDVQIWEGTTSGFPGYNGGGQYMFAQQLPLTIPTGTTAGGYFLLFVANADNAFVEPLEDNLFAKPMTVVP